MTAQTETLCGLNVSREAIIALQEYEALVRRWNPAINLISATTIETIWDRHIVDSAQLFPLAPDADHWVDLGSGAGFPGLVIAILGRELRPQMRVTLVESDARKATFLREAVRLLGLTATVVTARAEAAPSQQADVVSARALAPLADLLELAQLHLKPGGIGVFPKGRNWEAEVSAARKRWSFELEPVKSVSDADAAILVIRKLDRDTHH